ncbi:MAG TPA: hypothetical protein VL856_18455 [Acidimicrobiia bacterium]|jgi:hypothetical protein|nr:hypothetical protein [Acidimicrobiia bacterium]
MEALPPNPWNELATKHDLTIAIDRVEERLTLKMDASEQRLLAAFRGELTRTVIASQLATVVSVAAAVIAAARLL